MRILVFGKTGQMARELARLAPDARFVGRGEADLADPAGCAALIAGADCDAVINAAAFTNVDGAEAEPALAQRVNADAPGAMAVAAAQRGLPFVHISTDYVFDGTGDLPFAPDAPTAPLNTYGRTKLAGEQAVVAAGGTYAILRTSWVFSAHGRNFVTTMLRLGAERDHLRIVADQIGGPTPARDLAAAVLTAARRLCDGAPSGIYHFAGTPAVSWADFARETFARSGRKAVIEDILTRDYPTPAVRPKNSRLNCDSLRQHMGIAQPDWRAGLDHVLTELGVAR